MKAPAILYLGFVIFIISLLYLFTRVDFTYEDTHSSLNDANLETDLHLSNAQHFVKESANERGLYHVEQAIASLRNLENDIDLESGQNVESAIVKLEEFEEQLKSNEVSPEKMSEVFATTLKILSLSELRISERYAESDQFGYAVVALKYARLHLKNALEYENLSDKKFDLHVYYELDSLINAPEASPIEVSMKIDHMIEELNSRVTTSH
ncbi:MAG: hypothetical protein ABJG41_09690 [Cyclobacteriaceae bacterium]